MTADIDPTDIYCRLKTRAPRRPTARDILRNLDPRRTCGVPALDIVWAGLLGGALLAVIRELVFS